jgi:Fe-S-cluster-containing hydrogenase component 2
MANGGNFLPLTCQHCEDAPCAAACPEDAITRDDAQVRTVIDYNRCVGCQMCVHACPFGAMKFDADRGRPYKCDLCGGDPLCVAFCEPGALVFIEADGLQYRQTRQSARRLVGKTKNFGN